MDDNCDDWLVVEINGKDCDGVVVRVVVVGVVVVGVVVVHVIEKSSVLSPELLLAAADADVITDGGCCCCG